MPSSSAGEVPSISYFGDRSGALGNYVDDIIIRPSSAAGRGRDDWNSHGPGGGQQAFTVCFQLKLDAPAGRDVLASVIKARLGTAMPWTRMDESDRLWKKQRQQESAQAVVRLEEQLLAGAGTPHRQAKWSCCPLSCVTCIAVRCPLPHAAARERDTLAAANKDQIQEVSSLQTALRDATARLTDLQAELEVVSQAQ